LPAGGLLLFSPASVARDIFNGAELLRRTQSTLDGAGIVLDPDDAFEVKWLRERVGSSVH